MRNLFVNILCTLLLFCSILYANDIAIRHTVVSTELKIVVPAENIVSTQKQKNQFIVHFVKPLNITVDSASLGQFIKRVTAEGNLLTIELSADTDVFSKPSDDSLLIVFSPKRKVDNLKLSNEIEKPIISKVDELNKEPLAEAKLSYLDELLADGKSRLALTEVRTQLTKYVDGYYSQEFFFKLGQVYLAMGEKSDKYFLEAAAIFDQFTKEYPDSFRVADAMWKAAEAKERAGVYYESIFGYRKVMGLVPDTETGKMALEKIAKIYFGIGQYDKAIDIYKEYIGKYKERPAKVIGFMGLLFVKQKDFESAYLYFKEILDNGADFIELGPEILYAMAESFENKMKYADAINVYTKIYNLFPNDENADMAMYNAGLLMAKGNKNKMSKQLMEVCKDKYKGKRGALLSALYIANADMNRFSTEYWQEYLSDVLNTDLDINLKTEGNLFIIQSFFREKRYEVDLNFIAEFEKTYFDSPLLDKVYDIKQQIYIEQARAAFGAAQLDTADEIVSNLIREFPTTVYIEEGEKILENTQFSRIEKMFNEGFFIETIKAIEQFYINTKKVHFISQWSTLLDKAYFEYISRLKLNNEQQALLIYLRQYLINIPNGQFVEQLRKDLENLVQSEIIQLVKNKSFVQAVKFYEDNKGWIDRTKDLKLKDTVEGYIAYSLYKLGETRTASQIVKDIGDKKQPSISMVMLLLGMSDSEFDMNNLSKEDIKFVVDELKVNEPLRVLMLLDKYQKDVILKNKLKYDVIQLFENGERKKKLLALYESVKPLSGDVKRAIADLFLNTGMIYYDERQYVNVISVLNDYFTYSEKTAPGRAQALYIKGVAHLKQDRQDDAKLAFEAVVNDFASSEYLNLAKTALEDMDWNKKLKR